MSVDVEAAARAVMAADDSGVDWDVASDWYKAKCRNIAVVVLALVAEEQADLHAVVDALPALLDSLSSGLHRPSEDTQGTTCRACVGPWPCPTERVQAAMRRFLLGRDTALARIGATDGD